MFRGRLLGKNEDVAIKVIKKVSLKKFGDEIMTAIGNEVNILQEISNHQSNEICHFVVKIYDCFETTNNIYIILELCNQGNLQEILNKQKKLREDEAKLILFQVISALDYLERRGIAHRDIKPENIFIKDGIYKLGDFGFASQNNLFQTHLGTPPYM